MRYRTLGVLILAALAAVAMAPARAAEPDGDDLVEPVRAAIERGVKYLRAQLHNGGWENGYPDKPGGMTCLALLALLNAGVKADDPLVARGEGAPVRAHDPTNLVGRQDAGGGSALPRETPNAGVAQQKIAPLSAAKRRAMAAKDIYIDVMFLYTRKVASSYIDVHADLIDRHRLARRLQDMVPIGGKLDRLDAELRRKLPRRHASSWHERTRHRSEDRQL